MSGGVPRASRGGVLNQVMSHLAEVQARWGNTHLFLYTKAQSAKFFRDLNFYEITRGGCADLLSSALFLLAWENQG